MDNWLSSLTTWLAQLVKDIFGALVGFIHDAAVWVFDGILQALAAVISAIPAPDFLSSVSISALLGGLPPFALYVVGHLGLPAAFAILASGFGFRMVRKLLTLGQW